MTIYHNHHIIPRHMGGTDDPSNLIRLSIEEHAEAHRLLYETHGLEEDRIAWLALSGQVTMSEAKRLAQRLGAKKGSEKARLLPDAGLKGGLAIRDKQIGIHDPNKKHLKSKGGKTAIKKMKGWTKQSKWVNNGIIDTRISITDIDSYIENGWVLGRLFSPNRGKKKLTNNLYWINKDGKNKRVSEDQIDEYIINGWSSGMSMRS